MILVLTAWLTSPAAGQALDVSGVPFTTDDGDLQDLSLLWRPEEHTPGAVGASLRYGYAARPYWPLDVDDPLLASVTSFTLATHISASKRVALGFDLPVFPASMADRNLDDDVGLENNGFNLGDVRGTVPIGLVVPDFHSGGFGLSAIPTFVLPVGATRRYLGDGGMGAGLSVAPSYSWLGVAQLTAQVGIGAQPVRDDLPGRMSGSYLTLGAGGGIELHRTIALRGEFLHEQSLKAGDSSPGLGLVSLRGRYRNGLSWTAGGGVDLQGFTAAGPRIHAQVGWVNGRTMDRDVDLDGIVDADDACRFKVEVKNGYRDDDGCPDELAKLSLRAVDLSGEPVAGAKVGIDDERLKTDASGWVRFFDLVPETEPVIVVDGKGYTTLMVRDLVLQPGENERVLTLDHAPSRLILDVRAHDTGLPIDASLRITGPGNVDSQNVGHDGHAEVPLRPGTWKVFVYADFFEEQSFEVEVEEGTAEIPKRLDLRRTGVRISKEEVVGGVKVLFEEHTARFDEAWRPFLHDLAQTLLVYPWVDVVAHGHIDKGEIGDDLDKQRAEAAVAFLIEGGVAPERLSVEAHGDSQPAEGESLPEGANRRVEFSMTVPPDLVIDEVVRFAPGSSELEGTANSALAGAAKAMSDNGIWRIVVEGHADASENNAGGLSIQRANAVHKALIAGGVEERRLVTRGFGSSRPAGSLPAGNARVTFQALPLDDVRHELTFAEGASSIEGEVAETLGIVERRMLAAPDLRLDVVAHRAEGEDAVVAKARLDAVLAHFEAAGIDAGRVRGFDRGDRTEGAIVTFEVRVQPPVDDLLFFAPESKTLDRSEDAAIDRIVRTLRSWPAARATLVVRGHGADAEEGGIAYERAVAVRSALLAKGISQGRLEIRAEHVELSTEAPSESADGGPAAALSRRVEVHVGR